MKIIRLIQKKIDEYKGYNNEMSNNLTSYAKKRGLQMEPDVVLSKKLKQRQRAAEAEDVIIRKIWEHRPDDEHSKPRVCVF